MIPEWGWIFYRTLYYNYILPFDSAIASIQLMHLAVALSSRQIKNNVTFLLLHLLAI